MKAEPAYEWAGWNPDTNDATYAPASAHPQSVNRDYYVSWNNKQARDFGAADGTSATARCTGANCSTVR
ncbi:penicillin acylase family protein [Micromonospora sp. BRA006-A]|nr:penicillin acylase family protein [Micromonospora sp. BRA006-A]